MKISMILNGKKTEAEIDADMLLIDFVRSQGCCSVKRGCETSTAGCVRFFWRENRCCRVRCLRRGRMDVRWIRWKACRRKQKNLVPLLPGRAPSSAGSAIRGMIMNAIALFRENPDPSEEEIKEYLAGNLCRCSGYERTASGEIFEFPCLEKSSREVRHEQRKSYL